METPLALRMRLQRLENCVIATGLLILSSFLFSISDDHGWRQILGWPAGFAWFAFPIYVFKSLDAHAILRKIAQGVLSPDRMSFTFTQTIVDRHGDNLLYAIYISLLIFAASFSIAVRYIVVGFN